MKEVTTRPPVAPLAVQPEPQLPSTPRRPQPPRSGFHPIERFRAWINRKATWKAKEAYDHWHIKRNLAAYDDQTVEHLEGVAQRMLKELDDVAAILDTKAKTALVYAAALVGPLIPWLVSYAGSEGWAFTWWCYAFGCAAGITAASAAGIALAAWSGWSALEVGSVFPSPSASGFHAGKMRRFWLDGHFLTYERRLRKYSQKGWFLRIAQAALSAAVIAIGLAVGTQLYFHKEAPLLNRLPAEQAIQRSTSADHAITPADVASEELVVGGREVVDRRPVVDHDGLGWNYDRLVRFDVARVVRVSRHRHPLA